MEHFEKKMLDVISLSTIVIALASTGMMVTSMMEVYGGTILPAWLVRGLLILLALASFGFAVFALVHYVRR